MSAGCPGRMAVSCVSLKFAVTHLFSGTKIISTCPGWASAPTAADILVALPGSGRDEPGALEIVLGVLERGLHLRELGLRARPLRLQHRDLLLRGDEVRLGAGDRRLRLDQIRRGLLGRLLGAGTALDEVLGAAVLLLSESERRLGLHHLLRRLVDARLLRFDLGVEIGDRRVRLSNLGLGLGDRRLVIAGIDLHQKAAGLNQLVVGDRHPGDRADDLGAHTDIAGVDERVVRRFIIARLEPPDDTADERSDREDGCECGEARMASQQPRPDPLLLGLLILFGMRPLERGDAQVPLA